MPGHADLPPDLPDVRRAAADERSDSHADGHFYADAGSRGHCGRGLRHLYGAIPPHALPTVIQRPRAGGPPIDFLILARDEAPSLPATLAAIRVEAQPGDEVHVVADECQDDTASVALRGGAHVHIRHASSRAGKGRALGWWLRKMEGRDGQRVVLVLDADSRIRPGFAATVRDEFVRGAQAVQALVQPVPARNPVSQLAAVSDVCEQLVYNHVRRALGWPVRLRGTGMAIRQDVLVTSGRDLSTCVEDAELSLRLAARGIWPVFSPHAVVLDPKPADGAAARVQRARWLRGSGEILRRNIRELGRLTLQGPPGWSLISSILLKPRSFFLPLKCLMTAAAFGLAGVWGGAAWVVAGLMAILTALEVAFAAYAFWITIGPVPSARLATQLPRFLGLWIGSASAAAASDGTWVRTPRWPLEGALPDGITD